jgi:hypothetical protein
LKVIVPDDLLSFHNIKKLNSAALNNIKKKQKFSPLFCFLSKKKQFDGNKSRRGKQRINTQRKGAVDL